jgi:hypothetical protein
VILVKALKEQLNKKPSVVRYTGPYEAFEFQTAMRRTLLKILAERLSTHGLRFGTLTYYSKETGIELTSSGKIQQLETITYKLTIEGCTKSSYWEVDFCAKEDRNISNIVVDGVAVSVAKFKRMCELKTALLFS